jgi:hypothetical protein
MLNGNLKSVIARPSKIQRIFVSLTMQSKKPTIYYEI